PINYIFVSKFVTLKIKVTYYTLQVFIFRVRRGPFEEDFYQCVTYGFYTTVWEEKLYTTSTLVLMFILPLLTIITTYICTFYTIARNEQVFRECDSDKQMHVLRQKLFRKAKIKSLQITVVIVLAFVVCWTPYYMMMLTYIFLDPEAQLSQEVQSGIFFFGMSNSMVNPVIYGAFHLRKRGGKRRYQSSRFQSQSTINLKKRKNNAASSALETTCGVSVVEEETVLNHFENRWR
uniref:G-protein coupled receptors family 1 profile domain-containing protein n=1 Tax=Strigamia maritima TaxID=126957 RepID=T1IX13_STRMM